MFETVVCPKCRRRLQLSPEHMGKAVQCPTCEATFTAGEALPPPPQPAPPPTPEAVTAQPAKAPAGWDDDRPRPRRPRRPDIDRTGGDRKSWPKVVVVLGIVIGGGCIGLPILTALFSSGRRAPLPPVEFAPRQNFLVVQPPPPVDVPDRMLTPEEQRQHAKTFFDHFASIMLNPINQAGEMAAFDAARLVDTAFEKQFLPAALKGQGRLVTEFQQGVLQTSLYRGEDWWGNYEIKTLKQPRNRELIAVTRHTNRGNGLALRLRWWLAHRDGQWRITEVEDPDFGIRLSLLLAGAVPGADPRVHTLRDAATAIVANNFDNAERTLGGVRVEGLPKACAAAHQMLLASIRIRQRRFEETLTACTAAELSDPDLPGNDYLFAICYNSLNRNPKALKHAQAALLWYGDDPMIVYEIGLALQNQGKFVEAAANYRKALDAQPDHKDAFFGLIRCQGPGVANDDIRARFLKLPNFENHFQEFADDCWKVRDTATLKVLAEAMLSRAPRHADANYYLALVQTEQELVLPAVASLRLALANQQLDFRRDIYYAEFARNVVFRDQASAAYNGLPDRQRAFRALAEELRLAFKMDDMHDLVDLHARAFPKDPFLDLYRAEAQLQNEQFALADKSFARAFAAIDDLAVLDRHRPSWRRARYQTGDILGAYRDIGPAQLAFQQLADACWFDKKLDDLKKLVDRHAEMDPFDPLLPRYRWRLAIHEKRLDDAQNLFRAEIGKAAGAEGLRTVRQNFLFDMIDAGQVLEAYRRADHAESALEIIGMDLGGGDALDAVLQEHRKKAPNDPLLHMYVGQRAARKQDWAKAASEYKLGWPGLAEIKKPNWTHAYFFASTKADTFVDAYHDTGRRPDYFRQIASMLLNQKNVDAFERLLKVHRVQKADDPELPAYEARLKLLRGHPDEAAGQLVAFLKDRPLLEQQRIGDSFLADIATFDLAVEAYRCIPDKRDAFSHMIWKYRHPDRVKELERLIAEHARQQPDDPRLFTERGELHILKKEYALAEAQFAQAKLKNPKDHFAGLGLIRARVKLGKTAELYRELGASTRAFNDIANQCVFLKDGDQLERLLTEHRKAHPDAKRLAVWDVEANWQKKDYAAVVQALQADGGALLKNQNMRWKCESYLVRSLVRMKKTKEAVLEAETISKKQGSQVLLALAIASTGDMARFQAFLETKKNQRFFIDDCYRDEDLGPLLRGDNFRAVRDRYPPPPTDGPVPADRFDDWD